ncbi:unnamed protein product, partial [Prorocentrum cordatum]
MLTLSKQWRGVPICLWIYQRLFYDPLVEPCTACRWHVSCFFGLARPSPWGPCALGRSAPKGIDKVLRRLEHNAKERETGGLARGHASSDRELCKQRYINEVRLQEQTLLNAKREREQRWTQKMEKSPFTIDLWAEEEAAKTQAWLIDRAEQKAKRDASLRVREAKNLIQNRAIAESIEEVAQVAGRRKDNSSEKERNTLRSIQKGNERSAKIMAQRR